MTTPATPDLVVHLDEEADAYFTDFSEGFLAGLAWLKTHPTRDEAHKIASLHMEIRVGDDQEWSSFWHDADMFPTFVPHMEGEGYLTVINGPAHTAAMKADPEIAFPYTIEWERAWHFHSESGFWQGVVQAVYVGINQ